MKNTNLATPVMWVAFTAIAMTSVHAQTPLPNADQANIGPKAQIEATKIPAIPPCDAKLPCVKTAATLDRSEAHKCRPEYPSQSLRAGEVGLVGMQLLIDADGNVLDSKLDQSSGYPRLDAAAIKQLTPREGGEGKARGGGDAHRYSLGHRGVAGRAIGAHVRTRGNYHASPDAARCPREPGGCATLAPDRFA